MTHTENIRSAAKMYGAETAELLMLTAAPLYIKRKVKGFSLRALSKLVSVSRQALFLYEHGLIIPEDPVWQKLKEVLELKGNKKDYFYKLKLRRNAPSGFWKGKTCIVEGCKRPAKAKGYCAAHYDQMRNKGKTGPIKKRGVRKPINRGTCKFPGCNRKCRCKGYCGGHYRQHICGEELRPLRKRITKQQKTCSSPKCNEKYVP